MVAVKARSIMLQEPPDETVVESGMIEGARASHVFYLNIPVVLESKDRPANLVVSKLMGEGAVDGLGSQDSDPFNLLPIIETVTDVEQRGIVKRMISIGCLRKKVCLV